LPRIAIVGVGAIGGVIAALLQTANRHEITLCTRRPLNELTVQNSGSLITVKAQNLTDPADAQAVKSVLPSTPVLIGSGFDLDTAASLLAHADGAIVGTSLKPGNDVSLPVSAERVRLLREAMQIGRS